jgi:hypothetical protein
MFVGGHVPEQYVSKWQQIWRRWSEFEQEWNGDHRKSLLSSLMTAADSNRRVFLAAYKKKKLPQPTQIEIDELWHMGTCLAILEQDFEPIARRICNCLSNEDATILL